jgi:hypothetical protein
MHHSCYEMLEENKCEYTVNVYRLFILQMDQLDEANTQNQRLLLI